MGVQHRAAQAHAGAEAVHVGAVGGAHGLADGGGLAVGAVQSVDHVQVHCVFSTVRAARAAWMACHTTSGVAGVSMSVMPRGLRASRMAVTIAGGRPTVPVSAPPLTPRGLVRVGTGCMASLKRGKSPAC